MMVNWDTVYRRLFQLIDHDGPSYYSGRRFIEDAVWQIDPNFLGYDDYLKERNSSAQSTSRKVFFRDNLMGFDEVSRARLVLLILEEVGFCDAELSSEIKNLMGGAVAVPAAAIPESAWSSARLRDYLTTIDADIAARNYEHALTLCYTGLEGFFGAFLRARDERESYPTEIIDLAKEVRVVLREHTENYPDEILRFITQTAHAIDRARNRFSESHFADEAEAWLATYCRDLVNSLIRLLLHFM
jgi:hypothetical protein